MDSSGRATRTGTLLSSGCEATNPSEIGLIADTASAAVAADEVLRHQRPALLYTIKPSSFCSKPSTATPRRALPPIGGEP
jgi:hypothetical protein